MTGQRSNGLHVTATTTLLAAPAIRKRSCGPSVALSPAAKTAVNTWSHLDPSKHSTNSLRSRLLIISTAIGTALRVPGDSLRQMVGRTNIQEVTMTNLIFIRHGQTESNRSRRCMGWSNDGLNLIGKKQAQALATCLSARHIAVVYSSPLKRAIDTASPLAEKF